MKNKKILAIIICILLVFPNILTWNSLEVRAEEIEETEDLSYLDKQNGLEDLEFIPISVSDIPEDESAGIASQSQQLYASPSSVAAHNWDKYSYAYVYGQLSAKEQALYDKLDLVAKNMMLTKDDAIEASVSGRRVYLCSAVSYDGLSLAEAKEVMWIYIYQNPQYYFLSNEIFYNSTMSLCYLGVYDAFADGAARSNVSTQFLNQINAWISEIPSTLPDYTKAWYIYNMVCDALVYDQNPDEPYNQTVYSAVIQKHTVCAGYCKLYSMLCNATGIPCVAVTSVSHAWNKVGFSTGAGTYQWYNVDSTWGDEIYTSRFNQFGKSDYAFESNGHRDLEHNYDKIAPACKINDEHLRVYPMVATLDETNNSAVQLRVNKNELPSGYGSILYTSGNTSIATVSSIGYVSGVAIGRTAVTVSTTGLSESVDCDIKVYKKSATPEAPTLRSRTTNSITLNAVAGCVYSMDGISWQSSSEFTGLMPGTNYTFYAKRASSGYYSESAVSTAANISTLNEVIPPITVSYRTHVQSFGWQDFVTNGAMSGTSGLARRLEGIEIKVSGNNNLGIQYTTQCQSYGWLPWSANGDMNGTEGEARRLEAIKIQLTGADKDKYDVFYRVHAQSFGWLGWAKNGAPSGTVGYGRRLEGIQIVVLKKGSSTPGVVYQGVDGTSAIANVAPYYATEGSAPVVNGAATSNMNPQIQGANVPNVMYRTHVQSFGWQGWRYNGQMSGTSGLARRLEGIEIKLTNANYSGGILYTTHVQSFGWQGDPTKPSTWKANGEMAGTSGLARRLEAICITLTGEMASHYDVYYRVHAQTFGWMGWAKNGAPAGTAGYAKRLEGIEIVLVPKGGPAPGSTKGSYISK